MKKFIKFLSAALACIVLCGGVLSGCGSRPNNDVIIDPDGNVKPGADGVATTVKFWGWGDSTEVAVFTRLVAEFNKKYEGVISVSYVQRPYSSYGESLLTTLAGSKGPDVFYVEDRYFKQYASLNYLYDISDKYGQSTVIDESDLFDNTVSRYRYNIETTTSNDDDPLYALPKDLAPTAIYYNKTQFEAAGVRIISMTEEEALAAGYTVRGYDPVGKVFNNKVAMSWEDCVELSNLLISTGASQYGFFTEWWFNYGWSVGGNCVQYVETEDSSFNGGRYLFTLNDKTKNYIVKDDADDLTVNGTVYHAGEIISYVDKQTLTASQKESCNELPSQREAFTEFVRLSHSKGTVVDNVFDIIADGTSFYGADDNGDLYGYGITPNPTTIESDGKVGYFTSGKLGMLVTTMSGVRQIATNMKDEWDVAPMLVYKEYSDDGKQVLVHGVEAAHSGSVGLAINAKSNVATAAYLFAEYVASAEGQSVQAAEGFAIPIQRSVANSEVYLQSEWAPSNIGIFVDACEYETPGDWWFLRDKKWISDWQSVLNGDVRNGVMTLSQFYADNKFTKTQELLDAYTKAG